MKQQQKGMTKKSNTPKPPEEQTNTANKKTSAKSTGLSKVEKPAKGNDEFGEKSGVERDAKTNKVPAKGNDESGVKRRANVVAAKTNKVPAKGNDKSGVKRRADVVDAKTNKVPEKDCNALSMYILLGIIIVIVVIVCVLFSKANDEMTTIDKQSEIDKLFQDFKNQPPRSAKKLQSRVHHYLNHARAPQPFVLLVAAIQEDQMAANCFADRVGKIINPKPLMINGSLYADTSGDKVKLEIDKKLRNVFQKGKFPTAAIIYYLNLLPYSTLNLFYAYCDHDNPIFNEATIIFTVMLPLEYRSLLSTGDDIKSEGIVETYLQKEWSKDVEFDENMIGALLSRISDTIIVVARESKESLEQYCSIE